MKNFDIWYGCTKFKPYPHSDQWRLEPFLETLNKLCIPYVGAKTRIALHKPTKEIHFTHSNFFTTRPPKHIQTSKTFL